MLKKYYIIIFLLTGCTQMKFRDIPVTPIKYPSTNNNYKRDSLYIATTVREFMNKKVDIFDFYKQFNIPINKVHIDVDSIVYSPDSLKLIAFVIFYSPESDDLNKYSYQGDGFIGYRSSLSEPWTIYYFDLISTGGFDNYNRIRNIYRTYYFGKGEFKNEAEYIWDSIKKDKVLAYYGYNFDEKDFWTKSVVWKKGARLPGLYNFQTKGNVKPGDEDAVKIIPQLDYPDSLLKLYH